MFSPTMIIALSFGSPSAPAPAAATPVVVREVGIGQAPPRMRGPQAKLMAQRGAEVAAVRNLTRKLGLGPGATLRGFRYLPPRFLPDGRVEVTVEFDIPAPRRTR